MVKAGDSVVVKPGVADADFDVDIGGWQGRILEIESGEEEMLLIRWDSITLQNMPDWMIEECEERGLSWTEYYLEAENVTLTSPRDTKEEVARVIDDLEKRHAWDWLGEEGKRIREVLAGVDPDDEMAMLEAWERYMEKHLAFPFEAEVDEFQERGPLQAGDGVIVRGISLVDDLYGLIVRLTHHRRRYDFPLCDLEAVDEDSPNHRIIRDYRVWFANH